MVKFENQSKLRWNWKRPPLEFIVAGSLTSLDGQGEANEISREENVGSRWQLVMKNQKDIASLRSG